MMADKFDRTNLKRKVQRLEPYTTLVSKKRIAIFNNHNNTTETYSSSEIKLEHNQSYRDCKEPKDVKSKKINGNAAILLSPSSTGTGSGSSSSDESLEFMPASYNKSVIKSNQGEYESTSVMTRSASRKYSTVGAIHNKVNVEKELMRTKRWPVNISYPISRPEKEIELLKNTVSEAFFHVMSFCKLAKYSTFLSNKCSEEKTDHTKETLTSLDLSAYSKHKQIPAIIVDSSPEKNLAMAVHNDHSYALKYTEDEKLIEPTILNDPLGEFKLNEALNRLMLNTAMLKCLVCGEFPQDIVSYLTSFERKC